jgi:hypothetical protein
VHAFIGEPTKATNAGLVIVFEPAEVVTVNETLYAPATVNVIVGF